MSTIPASAIVQVTPSVLSAGGRALDIIGLLLTTDDDLPMGIVQPFASAADVKAYFGADSLEGALAAVYFAGFSNSNIKPAQVKFARYAQAATRSWVRGGPLGLTLAQLQALTTGTVAFSINGVTITAASVDLSAATSFSNAATIIQAAFTAHQATAASAAISGTTLTLGGAITGTWEVGQVVAGAGVPAGLYIVAFLSGTPNTDGATYQLSGSATVSAEAMTGAYIPTVEYNGLLGEFRFLTSGAGADQSIGFAVTSTLATALKLTQATGAVVSPGAAASTPGAFMDGIVAINQDWATFMTCFDPDNSGNDNKYAFAVWNGEQNNRYCYVAWDTDTSPAEEVPATTSLGYRLQQAQISGTIPYGGDGTNPVTAVYAAFVCGWAASLNFSQHNGRTNLTFRLQSGLVATCSNQSKASNLAQNGYNFYGAYATANQLFIFDYNGQVSGEFLWADSYINQIWMNNQFQLALMVLLVNSKSIPYNRQGYSMIEAACGDVINQALNFGAIRIGVTLSEAQAAEVNDDAGLDIAQTLNQQGWYLQVLDASPQVRQARQSPPTTFWYMDGQSVQQINLSSVELA